METVNTNSATKFSEKNSAEILNAIRNDKSTPEVYRDMVPEANIDDISSLHAIGNVLNENPELQNTFANALIGRIVLTLVKSKSFMNPYAMFKRGILDQGDLIQDVYIDLVTPQQYNPGRAETNWMKRKLPAILAQYYRMNSQTFYKTTVSTADLNRAFTSWQGVVDLVARIVGRLADSMQYDEFMATKYMLSAYILAGRFATVDVVGTPASDIIDIKGISNAIVFPATEYNPAGVITNTPKEEQYLFIGAKYSAEYDVDVLAKAFNMDKVEFMGHQIMFDNLSVYDYRRMRELFPEIREFTSDEVTYLESIVAVLVDQDAFMIFDNLLESRQQENGEGLYWQHWLHSWKTYAMSPFANQIVFVKEAGEVESLEITPATIAGVRGKSVFFTAKATITGGINSGAVKWSVNSDVSTIGTDGQLMIGYNEAATELTVTATSLVDSSITATAKVTLSALGGIQAVANPSESETE